MKDRNIILTDDGSSSIYIPELDEGYHSSRGALNESIFVYINTGLAEIDKREISIFEMGFGTGLNALLSKKFADENDKIIKYYSIEKYPLTSNEVETLNFNSILPDYSDSFKSLHSALPGREMQISQNFTLHKINGDIKDLHFDFKFDLCYYDAFSPEIQPDLWTTEIFKRIYDAMLVGGVFCTYSAKGQVRRDLRAVGFKTKRLTGPPGKWMITRARKELFEETGE